MTPIDYGRLAEALAYYQSAGYTYVEAPWIVGQTAYGATKPPKALDFVTLGGFLAASAEQSFLELMLAGRRFGQAVALTPCFRHETYDELHQSYFMKVELIDAGNTSNQHLESMIELAAGFYSRYADVRLEPQPNDSIDIVEATTGIELGSYGRRRFDIHRWTYGTGLAEPRLAQAIDHAKRLRRAS